MKTHKKKKKGCKKIIAMGFEGQIVSRWISMSVFDEFEGESHTKQLSCHVCPNWLYELFTSIGSTYGQHSRHA